MARKPAVAALDVGTSKVVAAVAVPEAAGLRVLGVAGAASGGVRRGAIVDLDLAAASLRAAAQRVRRLAGRPLPPVMLGSAGGLPVSLNERSELDLSGESGPIRPEHVADVLARVRQTEMPPGYQLVHAIPRGYVVDGYEGCTNPVGMAGTRLTAHVHLVGCQAPVVENLWKVVDAVDLRVDDFAVAGLASAESVLTNEERREGAVLIDMGAGATQVVVVTDGEPVLTAAVPLGGEHVTADIAAGLRLTRAQAEALKVRHACADPDVVPAERRVELEPAGTGSDGQRGASGVVDCSERELAEIAGARVEEIVHAVADIVARGGRGVRLGAGAVLTGGGCRLRGLQGVAMRILGMPVRCGGALGAGATLGAPECSAAVGLLQMQAERMTGSERLLPLGGDSRHLWPPWRWWQRGVALR